MSNAFLIFPILPSIMSEGANISQPISACSNDWLIKISIVSTLTKFHDHLYSDRFNSNSKFVFVLSNPYRIPWTFLESKGISATTTYADWIAKQDGRDHLIEGDYTSEEFYAIDSMYRSLQEEINHQNFKNITYLHTISKANSWPMIVFRVFGISPDPFGKVYDEDKFIKPFTDLNDILFKFYN